MVRIFTFLISFLFVSGAFAQYSNLEKPTLPETLKTAFRNKYPGATNVEWELEDEHYEVEFTNKKGQREELWYSKTEVIIREKLVIKKNELPKSVLATIKEKYPEYRIDDPRKIIEKNQQVLYEVELESFTQEWHVWFDETGNETNRIAD